MPGGGWLEWYNGGNAEWDCWGWAGVGYDRIISKWGQDRTASQLLLLVIPLRREVSDGVQSGVYSLSLSAGIMSVIV